MHTSILFVEDNEDLRDNAALVLGLEGYAVQVARDGREALDLLNTGYVPNLIVSDIMMPRMDGYKFFEAVREKKHLEGVPFIFLTARGSRRDQTDGRRAGVDDYLVKPFEPEEFLIAVQSNLRRAERMQTQAAESLNDARRLLVQVLSHELRTPLTYVTGGFALLAEELEDQGAAENDDIHISLELIQSGTQRLNRLAEQMVLYSEIISGFVEQQVRNTGEALELSGLVIDAQSLLHNFIQERRVTFEHVMPEGNTVSVFGIRDLLMTAIGEVIRNAIQYSPEGAQIRLVIGADGGVGTLTVIDPGQGIAPEHHQAIWDVLIQSGRENNEQQGIGMGLPIAKGITEAHRGKIKLLHSVPGEGTAMQLCFPLAADAPA
ncbi:MAG: response regulator [Anaerolineae bacterium]|nr:response regulator [Anaerolineae bacterium]